jgi:hypothetical protein
MATSPTSEPLNDSLSAVTQAKLLEAEAILAKAVEDEPRDKSPKLQLLYSLILSVRVYSASGNSIPGLQGLGLIEAVKLAEAVVAHPALNERAAELFTYRPVAEAFSI